MALLEADIQKTNPGAALDDSNAAEFWGFRTERFTRLASRTPSFAELLDHDLMHQWASRALKQGYWLNTGQAMIVGPGEREQVLHRDIASWPSFIDGANDAPEAMVSILLALSDFTEEVGATRVVPGNPTHVASGAAYVSPRHGVDDAPMNWLVDFKDAKLHLAAKQD